MQLLVASNNPKKLADCLTVWWAFLVVQGIIKVLLKALLGNEGYGNDTKVRCNWYKLDYQDAG